MRRADTDDGNDTDDGTDTTNGTMTWDTAPPSDDTSSLIRTGNAQQLGQNIGVLPSDMANLTQLVRRLPVLGMCPEELTHTDANTWSSFRRLQTCIHNCLGSDSVRGANDYLNVLGQQWSVAGRIKHEVLPSLCRYEVRSRTKSASRNPDVYCHQSCPQPRTPQFVQGYDVR